MNDIFYRIYKQTKKDVARFCLLIFVLCERAFECHPGKRCFNLHIPELITLELLMLRTINRTSFTALPRELWLPLPAYHLDSACRKYYSSDKNSLQSHDVNTRLLWRFDICQRRDVARNSLVSIRFSRVRGIVITFRANMRPWTNRSCDDRITHTLFETTFFAIKWCE